MDYPAFDLYDLSTAPPAVVPGAVPFAQIAAELETIYGPGLCAKGTWNKVHSVLNELKALGVVSSDQLTVPLLAKYVSSRPKDESPWTTRGQLSHVRVVCSYAEHCGYLRVSPFKVKGLAKWVRCPQIAEGIHLSRAEIRAILDRMKADIAERTQWAEWRARRIYVATAITAYAALRRNEMLRSQVVDFDLDARVIHIVQRSGMKLKTSASAQPVPMPEALVPIVADWLPHRLEGPPGWTSPRCVWMVPALMRAGPWQGGSPGYRPIDALKDAAERVGVKEVSWQILRRSWATHAEHHGLGPALIQRVLRHTSVQTSERHYRKADIANLTEKVAGMDF
jgi:integrase